MSVRVAPALLGSGGARGKGGRSASGSGRPLHHSSGTAPAGRCGPTAVSILGRARRERERPFLLHLFLLLPSSSSSFPPPPASGGLRGRPSASRAPRGERGRGREIQLGCACGDRQKGRRRAGGGRPGVAGSLSDGAAPAALSALRPVALPQALRTPPLDPGRCSPSLCSPSPWRRRN